MSKGSAKPPIAGKPMTVVFDDEAASSVARLMRRAKRENKRESSRNAVINRAVKTADGMTKETV